MEPETSVSFDAASCSVDAIQRAAYRMSNRISVELHLEGGTYHCDVRNLRNEPASGRDIADFRIEVTDQILRERIRAETAPIRNTILALAFSQADLQEAD